MRTEGCPGCGWAAVAARLVNVTGVLLSIDPAIVMLSALVWTWAGLRAGGLVYAATPGLLRRRAGRVLALVSLGLALIAVRVVLVGALAGSGWWFVQETVVLSLPVLVVPAATVVVTSGPRPLSRPPRWRIIAISTTLYGFQVDMVKYTVARPPGIARV